MSRLFAPALAVLLVFSVISISGCGGGNAGGDAQPPGGATPAPASAPAPASPSGAEAQGEDNVLSPQPEQVFEPFPSDEAIVPKAILDRLSAKQPMLVLFYDPAQKITDDQRAAIDAAMKEYRGLIDLVSFDIGKYVTSTETGTITMKPGITADENANKVARLLNSDNLNITYTPYIIFVDAQGYITHRYRGYVDEKAIEREILRATQ